MLEDTRSLRSWVEGGWAENSYKRAIELNPNFPDVRAFYSHFLSFMGRTEEALSQIELAIELDPFNPTFHGLYGYVLNYLKRYDDAIAAARTGLALHGNNPLARFALQCGYIGKGMRDEQLAMQRARIALDPERLAAFDRGFEEGGYEGAQQQIADILTARHGKSEKGAYRGFDIAFRYLDARNYDKAIIWLEKAYEEHDPNLPYITMPFFDPLHSYPRFLELLRKMNLPLDVKK